MARSYRGALIGAGGIARTAHLPAFLAASPRIEIVAALDSDPNIAPLDGVPLFRDRPSLLAAGPLDFIDVCTPPSSHLPLARWALDHGLHVLCEKPVAVRPEEAERIRCAARAANRVVMPCHQYRFNPVWKKVRRWLDEEAIGRWYLAEFDVYRLMADPGTDRSPTPWRGRASDARGGVLLDHGTHLIYQLLDAAGPPTCVRAWAGRLRHASYDVEDTAHLLFEFPGRMAKMFLTWAAHRRENRIRFFGDRGTIEWNGGLLTLDRDGTTETFDHSAELNKDAYAAWFADLFGAFADAMDANDAEPLNDIARVADVLQAAYASDPAMGALVGAA